MSNTVIQPSPSSSKKKRHACVSPMKSKRNEIIANYGFPSPTVPLLHSGSTVYGSEENLGKEREERDADQPIGEQTGQRHICLIHEGIMM